MKKLMIYTKHRRINILSLFGALKENSSLIFFFTLFLCGLFIGSIISIYNIRFFSEILSDDKDIINNIILPLFMFISIFLAGFSCIGLPYICLLPLLSGVVSGYNYTDFIIINGTDAYINFIVKNILPTILISISVILASKFASEQSTEIAGIIILKKNNIAEIKKYIIRCSLLFAVFIVGIILINL